MNKSEEKKEKILKIAQIQFSKYGLFKTSIDDIARVARMGKSSIYYYFQSKEDIFKSVLEKEMSLLLDKITTAINAAKTPCSKLREFILTRMKSVKELANIYSTLRDEYLIHHAFIQKFRENFDKKEISIINSILSDGVNKNEFSINNLELTSFAIGTAVKGLEYEWAIKVDEKDIEKNINSLLDVLFFGIVKR